MGEAKLARIALAYTASNKTGGGHTLEGGGVVVGVGGIRTDEPYGPGLLDCASRYSFFSSTVRICAVHRGSVCEVASGSISVVSRAKFGVYSYLLLESPNKVWLRQDAYDKKGHLFPQRNMQVKIEKDTITYIVNGLYTVAFGSTAATGILLNVLS